MANKLPPSGGAAHQATAGRTSPPLQKPQQHAHIDQNPGTSTHRCQGPQNPRQCDKPPFNNGFFSVTVHVHITSLKEETMYWYVCVGVLFQHLWILNCATMEWRKGQEDHSWGQVSAKAE